MGFFRFRLDQCVNRILFPINNTIRACTYSASTHKANFKWLIAMDEGEFIDSLLLHHMPTVHGCIGIGRHHLASDDFTGKLAHVGSPCLTFTLSQDGGEV